MALPLVLRTKSKKKRGHISIFGNAAPSGVTVLFCGRSAILASESAAKVSLLRSRVIGKVGLELLLIEW